MTTDFYFDKIQKQSMVECLPSYQIVALVHLCDIESGMPRYKI